MQFNFPSLPSAIGAGKRATASPAATDSNTAVPGDASSSDAGFDQVLAGVRKPADPAAGVASPGGANPPAASDARATATDAVGTDARRGVPAAGPGVPVVPGLRAGLVVAGVADPGQAATSLIAGDGGDGSADADTDPSLSSSDPSDAKDLTTVGDLQALAVAAGLVMPTVQPLTSIPSSAGQGTALPGNGGANSSASVLNGGIVSAMMLSARTGTAQTAAQAPGQTIPMAGMTANSPAAFPGTAVAADPQSATAAATGTAQSVAGQTADAGEADAVAPASTTVADVPAQPLPQTAAGSSPGAGPVPDAAMVDRLPRWAARAATSGITGVATPTGLAEKFAALADQVAGRAGGNEKPLGKTLVDSAHKQVAEIDPMLGTSTAEHDATMPAGSTLTHSNDTATVVAASSSTDAAKGSTSVPQPVALPSTAHQAVEAVLSAADRIASRTQHSVNLQFNVGGSDLNVRVELRAGEVHTTFRTDSAELRAALSNEWRSVTSQSNSERPTRLAPPVFTANGQNNSSFSGDGAERQRQSDGQAPQRGFAGTNVRSASMTSSRGTANPAPVSRSVAANSLHLHTLA